MNIIKVEDVKKYYGKGNAQVKAVDGISFDIKYGDFLAVVGTSGSGKSTLLHSIGGLDKPTEGKVFIDNKNIYDLKDSELTILRRRKVGFIFQKYNLIPNLNVFDNIITPIILDNKKPDLNYIEDITKTLRINDVLDRKVTELSGGQQQRVGIARAIAAKPDVVLADEPTGNLDSKNALEVIGLFKLLNQKYNQTIVMITHDEALAQTCDRKIRLEDGKIVGWKYEMVIKNCLQQY